MNIDLFNRIEKIEKTINAWLKTENAYSSDLLELSEETKNIRDTLENGTYKVAVIGAFSVGKSTFLNAMIGKAVLYSSAKEATGVITTIQNSTQNNAIVHFKDGSTITMNINNFSECKNLNDYLDKDTKYIVDHVNVKHAFLGNDDDIVLIDTPGLEGMDEKLMNITKKAMREANATIILVGNRGLSQKEIELLQDKNTDFGAIRTKNKFLIINKIGSYYEKYDNASQELERLRNEVETQLKEGNVSDVKIFALDSRDYLWARDNELYEKQKKYDHFTDIKSQEEYRIRSKYEKFTKVFFELLRKDNRDLSLIDDLKDKLSDVESCIEDIEKEIAKVSSEKIQTRRNELEKQKSHFIELGKKLNRNLARDISEYSEEFLLQVIQEIEQKQQNLIYNIPKKIQLVIRNTKVNTPEKHQEIYNDIKQELDLICTPYQQHLLDLINGTYAIIKSKYKKDMEKINIPVSQINFSDHNLQLCTPIKGHNMEEKINNWEVELNEDIILIKQELDMHKDFLANTSISNTQQVEQDIREIEHQWKQTKLTFGLRPKAIPIMELKTYTEGIWFWKKEISLEEDSGKLDDSLGEEWDSVYFKSNMDYLAQLEIKQLELNNIRQTHKELDDTRKKIARLEDELDEAQKQLSIFNQRQHNLNLKNEQQMLDIDRQNLSIQLKNQVNKTLSSFIDELTKECYRSNDEIKNIIKTLVAQALTNEDKKITHQINVILEENEE